MLSDPENIMDIHPSQNPSERITLTHYLYSDNVILAYPSSDSLLLPPLNMFLSKYPSHVISVTYYIPSMTTLLPILDSLIMIFVGPYE
jgi:hypothetical protein